MTHTRLSLAATFALLGAALPAYAQAPVAAPVAAPAVAPAPAPQGPAPAPIMPARAGDDLTGTVGFGVGIIAGKDELILPDTGNLIMKYWLNDAMALVPKLSLGISKAKAVTDSSSGPTAWTIAPQLVAEFTLLKGASTRLEAGAGLGLGFGKNNGAAFAGGDPNSTQINLFIPVVAEVEHFFTRWFAMSVGAQFNFLQYQKQGDAWQFAFAANNVSYMGSLYFYTD